MERSAADLRWASTSSGLRGPLAGEEVERPLLTMLALRRGMAEAVRASEEGAAAVVVAARGRPRATGPGETVAERCLPVLAGGAGF